MGTEFMWRKLSLGIQTPQYQKQVHRLLMRITKYIALLPQIHTGYPLEYIQLTIYECRWFESLREGTECYGILVTQITNYYRIPFLVITDCYRVIMRYNHLLIFLFHNIKNLYMFPSRNLWKYLSIFFFPFGKLALFFSFGKVVKRVSCKDIYFGNRSRNFSSTCCSIYHFTLISFFPF